MRLTPATELEHRCSRLQELMVVEGVDAVVVVQNADLFYFTGTIQSGSLYIPVQGQPLYMVQKDFLRARMESGLKEVAPISSLSDIARISQQFGYPVPKRIGLELDIIPVAFFESYRSLFPAAEFINATQMIRHVRMIKSHYEIHLMKDAADQLDMVYRRANEIIRAGITELELSAELEFTARTLGHQGLMRIRSFNTEFLYCRVISGTDSAVPAYAETPLGGMGPNSSFGIGAGLKRIDRDEPIIIDFCGCVDGYLVNQTRLYAIGCLSDRLRTGYDDMLAIQQYMMELVEPGADWGEVYDRCLARAAQMGYAENFMGAAGSQVSFIGHGVGIEIDEYPVIARSFNSMQFEVGMVFAFGPKLVFPGEGAVGIENTFYISNDGLKKLNLSSDELVVLP